MEWYYLENGQQRGPVSREVLIAMLIDGRLNPNELVWREGMAQWTMAVEVPELGAGTPPLSAHGSLNPYSPPSAPYRPATGVHVPTTYLWQSIVVTLLCCMPFGVVAIVFAAKVDGLAARGDAAGAERASRNAKLWSTIAAVCGLLPFLAYLIFAGVAAANGTLR